MAVPPSLTYRPRKFARRYHARLTIAGAFFFVLALALILIGLARTHSYSALAAVPVQLTFDTGLTAEAAVSRDGSAVVYTFDRGPRGNASIWIQQPGKTPRQLTDDPTHNVTPDISPDGKRVVFRVFRSWRQDEGIWSVPVTGGEPKLLVKGGYVPRFSPDGKRIAFTALERNAGHIFVIPADGGVPEQLDYGVDEANCPVWSPDGSEIVFAGQAAGQGNLDLWTAKARNSRRQFARALGIEAKLRAQKLPPIAALKDCPQDWADNRLLFVTHQHDTTFVFEATSLNQRSEDIHPLPFALGTNGVRFVRSGRRMSVLFAPERRRTNVWVYDATGTGRLEQFSHDNTLKAGTYGSWPALSSDGNVLAFITDRAESRDICVKQRSTGAERLLAAAPSEQSPLHP